MCVCSCVCVRVCLSKCVACVRGVTCVLHSYTHAYHMLTAAQMAVQIQRRVRHSTAQVHKTRLLHRMRRRQRRRRVRVRRILRRSLRGDVGGRAVHHGSAA